ncbi:MAG: hypothetical protein DHS20C15_12370 [Planctomycetota bacterium]|nr:MAG: hypothetical protein DHS20C15_12370 [Planctomycetota bacterium]
MICTSLQLLLAGLLSAPMAAAQAVDVTEQATVRAATPAAFAGLGRSLALNGNLALAGAPGVAPNEPSQGSAVLFEVTNGSWSELQELSPSGSSPTKSFGCSVAASNNTMIVGDSLADDCGAVYVFTRAGPESTIWSQQARLLPADGAPFDRFGSAVAISGNTALIGAPLDDDGGDRTGSAYVFVRTGNSWTQQAKLHAAVPEAEARFGSAVALDGNQALIGAPHATFPNNFPGFARVFMRTGSVWNGVADLQPSTALAGDGFGTSVALNAGQALVGAPYHDAHGSQSGAAFVYEFVAGNWVERATLLDANGASGDQAGQAVATVGGVAFVGAPYVDNTKADTGRLHVWQRVNGSWQQRSSVEPTTADGGDAFGQAVAASSSRLIVGSPGDDEPSNAGSLTAFLADIVEQQVFFDLGLGLPGFFGQAVLDGIGTLEPDSSLSLSLTGAQPVSHAFVFLGFTQANTPLRGGTLVPSIDIALKPIFLGFEGGFFLEGQWPVGIPAGFETYLQAWWVDPGGVLGVASSNALKAVAP